MSDTSSFRRSFSSGMIPTSSPEVEPITTVPAIPVSPFSASINPIEDAVPVKSDLLDVEDSIAAVDAESNHGRNGWITECLLWFASCRTCCRRRRFQSDYIVILGNASELGSNTCLLSGEISNNRFGYLIFAHYSNYLPFGLSLFYAKSWTSRNEVFLTKSLIVIRLNDAYTLEAALKVKL